MLIFKISDHASYFIHRPGRLLLLRYFLSTTTRSWHHVSHDFAASPILKENWKHLVSYVISLNRQQVKNRHERGAGRERSIAGCAKGGRRARENDKD
jgi:hypothetical protein